MSRLDRAIAAYLAAQEAQNHTQKTLRWHATSLGKFRAWCEGRGLDLPDIDRSVIHDYLAMLRHAPGRAGGVMSSESVRTYYRSLRAFFAWLADEEFIAANPTAKVRMPKAEEHEVETFSAEELRRLLAVCTGPHGDRDRAIILTLYDTGIRAGELCGARIDDLTDIPPSLRVYGKGRKYRTVPLGTTAMRAVRRYLRGRDASNPYLFEGRGAQPLTANGLLQMLGRRGAVAGVKAHPHKFRHTFAIAYLREGGDLFSLQKILGHTSLEMVRHYARLADVDVLRRHAAYSPGDRLKLSGN